MRGRRFPDRQNRALDIVRQWRAYPAVDGVPTIKALAAEACYSPGHLRDVFRSHLGESIGLVMRRRRLDAAAAQLVLSSASVTASAMSAGYRSPEAFTRAFKSRFGVTPSSVPAKYPADGQLARAMKLGLALAKLFCVHDTTYPQSKSATDD